MEVKCLLSFSLKRRFLNKTSIMIYSVIFVLIGLLAFSDKLIRVLLPQFYEVNAISVKGVDPEIFIEPFNEILKLDEKADLIVNKEGNKYIVTSQYPLSSSEALIIQSMISMYENLSVEPYEIEYEYSEDVEQTNDSFYVIITTVYFMVLSFATMAANEVVMEKSTHILETIGSIVGTKYHFITKVLLGWAMILIQSIYLIISIGFWLSVRIIYDKVQGLLDLGYRLNLINQKYSTIKEWIESLNIDVQMMEGLFISLLFLLVGIGIIQIIMIALSSKINTMEEAGVLHTPLQLLFMFIYYVSILLNTPQQLLHGWGYWLSFTPIFSMLLMPLRIMKYGLNWIEILLSLWISIACLYSLFKISYQYYDKHIFEYKK